MTYIPSHSSKKKFLNLRVGWGSRIGCIGAKNPNISKHQVGLTSTIVLWGWFIFKKMKIVHKEIDNFPIFGRKHTTPPKNCSHKHKNYAFGFICTRGCHILDYFCSFQNYCISFRLKLLYLKRNFNKYLWTWPHEVYLCQNKYVREYENL